MLPQAHAADALLKMQEIEVVKHDVGLSSGLKFSWNLTLCMIRFPVFTHEHKFSPDLCSSAQDDCYCLIWHRAGPKSRVHPSGAEGLGAELSQTLQGPRLQPAWHGKKHEASSNLICQFVQNLLVIWQSVQDNTKYSSHMDEHVYSRAAVIFEARGCNFQPVTALNPWAEWKDPEIQFGAVSNTDTTHKYAFVWWWGAEICSTSTQP